MLLLLIVVLLLLPLVLTEPMFGLWPIVGLGFGSGPGPIKFLKVSDHSLLVMAETASPSSWLSSSSSFKSCFSSSSKVFRILWSSGSGLIWTGFGLKFDNPISDPETLPVFVWIRLDPKLGYPTGFNRSLTLLVKVLLLQV